MKFANYVQSAPGVQCAFIRLSFSNQNFTDSVRQLTTTYDSLRPLATAYDSSRQLTTAYVSVRQLTRAHDSCRQLSFRRLTTAHDSLQRRTTARDSVRQITTAYDSSRQLTTAYDSLKIKILNETNLMIPKLDKWISVHSIFFETRNGTSRGSSIGPMTSILRLHNLASVTSLKTIQPASKLSSPSS